MADPTALTAAAAASGGTATGGVTSPQLLAALALISKLGAGSGDYTQKMSANTLEYASRVPSALFILLLGIIAIRLLRALVSRFSLAAHMSAALRSMIESIVGFVGWVIVLASTLSALGLNQISVALGGSIALVAMALATGLNSITQDLMAGIFLISDEDFNVGYRVIAAGVEGVVEKLNIRKTKLRTDDGKLHVIPNRNVDSGTYVVLRVPAAPAGIAPAPGPRPAGDPGALAEEPAQRKTKAG